MQLSPLSRPSSTSLLSGFVSLRYALDWGFLPFFLDLRTCDVSFFLHVVWPASPAATAQVPPSIRTCTADFRNRSYEVCNRARKQSYDPIYLGVCDGLCARYNGLDMGELGLWPG